MAATLGSMLVRTAKEVARHMLHRLGVKRGFAHLRHSGRAERFSRIYADGVWRQGTIDAPASGGGSSLPATTTVRHSLPSLLDELGARVVLDVGCGDFTWMRSTPIAQEYIGVDIVQSVIDANNRDFRSDRRNFFTLDAVSDALPDADVVLCREVVFHLSFDDARKLFRNILSRPREFVICTNDLGTWFNRDIESGDFRSLNLHRRPFNFPAPARLIPDDRVSPGRQLAVWPAAALRSALGL